MTPAIEVRGLSYGYPDGTQALSDLSFAAATGERLGLIGPNGAGKSTLLLHLNGILPERPGEDPVVHVCGVPVAGEHLAEVRRMVGLLFQDPDDQIFCPTVAEDVAFGPEQLGHAGVDGLVEEALARVGLSGFGPRSPDRLSEGEKRRVCLAGVLACAPRILVLDEPTSGLDPRGRRELRSLLAELPVTQVIATHDLELVVTHCTRVILLDGGRIVASGSPEEILGDEPLMVEHGLERPHILSHRHPHP